jgi:hypothetical protein
MLPMYTFFILIKFCKALQSGEVVDLDKHLEVRSFPKIHHEKSQYSFDDKYGLLANGANDYRKSIELSRSVIVRK